MSVTTKGMVHVLLCLTLAALQPADPDALYAQREDYSKGAAAAKIWAERLASNPRDFESAVRLARARYWLGGHAPAAERKAIYEAGIAVAQTAVALKPDRPEGHFWTAANMGALAESFGLRQGLKYRGAIKRELEAVLRIDPGFQQGSADRALGRWYFRVPGLFGGSDRKSEEHLRKALTYNPNSTATLYFLAETLIELKRKDEAKAAVEQLLAAPDVAGWGPEDREFKRQARRLLETLGR
jgi:tetratricopeptide (TPR) repeat protein